MADVLTGLGLGVLGRALGLDTPDNKDIKNSKENRQSFLTLLLGAIKPHPLDMQDELRGQIFPMEGGGLQLRHCELSLGMNFWDDPRRHAITKGALVRLWRTPLQPSQLHNQAVQAWKGLMTRQVLEEDWYRIRQTFEPTGWGGALECGGPSRTRLMLLRYVLDNGKSTLFTRF